MEMNELIILLMSIALAYCTDPCPSKQTCHECIQNPNCAWCAQEDTLPTVVRDDRMRKRCFSPHEIQHPCRAQDIVNPNNTMTVVENISVTAGAINDIIENNDYIQTQSPVWLSPQKLDLKLRIDKPLNILVTYLNAPMINLTTTENNINTNHVTQQSVKLMDNSTSDINITYMSKCIGNYSWELSNKCEDLQANDMVTFQIIIQVNNCTNDAIDRRKYISIYPKGINASLIINLEVICDCACEKQVAVGSRYCSGGGDKICGVCRCNPDNYGEHCECAKQNTDSLRLSDLSPEAMENNCRHDNNSKLCSGRGTCLCGICMCDSTQRSYGKYCECDDSNCPTANGLMCSGPEHGVCRCGYCLCRSQYSGVACENTQTDVNCLPPDSNKECSGNGRCINGVCQCSIGTSGRFCENNDTSCPTANGLICSGPEHGVCVSGHCLCQLQYSGVACENIQDNVNCLPPDSNIECSGNGGCVNGLCECIKGKTGRFCENNDTSCPTANGLICSGPEHGYCSSGYCFCMSRYIGVACEITQVHVYCLPPDSNKTCSGNGRCVNGLCECSIGTSGRFCEHNDSSCPIANGLICSGPEHGYCESGSCFCQSQYIGVACQSTQANVNCFPPDSDKECSGNGTCINGFCQCSIGISGRFCENNDRICPTPNGLICSGPEHGICVSGDCFCQPHYTGVACENTQDSDVNCLPPDSNKECSGNGRCINGICQCSIGKTGRFCENNDTSCPTANGSICSGPEHGHCASGSCTCQPQYSGVACELPLHTVN